MRRRLPIPVTLVLSLLGLLQAHAQCPEITSSSLTSPDCFAGSTPCDLCPGDQFTLTAEGTGLPDNGCINWYYGTTPGFNPYNGEGTLIGCGMIDAPTPPPCDVCPGILAIWIDACGTPEGANEFMIIHSGSGFNVNNLGIDYDPSNNNLPPSTDDVNINGGSCGWQVPSASVISNMQASGSCNGTNIIPAGPGTNIPPGVLVVIWTSSAAATPYSFESLCAAGQTIYVMQSTCARAAGAFSNNSSNGLRTTSISLNNCNCSDAITHDTDDPALLGDGDYAVVDNGNVTYGNNGCGGNPPAPLVEAPEIMVTPPTVDDVSFTIPEALCNGGPYSVVGIVNPLANGCPQVFTDEFSFNVLCPDATASVTGTPCEGESVTLQASGGTSYQWTGPNGFSSNDQNPVLGPLTAAMAGTYTVTVSNASGCTDESDVDILVFPAIDAEVDPSMPAFCPGGSVILSATGIGGSGNYTYAWTYPGGSGNAPSVTVSQAGMYSVTVTDGNGCAAVVNGTVSQAAGLNVSVSPDPAVICAGGTVDLAALAVGGSGGYAYLWTTPGGNMPSDPIITVSQAGIYFVTVTDQEGCTGTSNAQVTVNSPPTVSVQAVPAVLCPGGSSTLTATGNGGAGGYAFGWTTPVGPQAGNPVTALQSGSYVVTVIDAAGCTGTDTLNLQPGQPLTLSILPDPPTFCPGASVDLTVSVSGDMGNPLVYDWGTPGGPATGNPLTAGLAGLYTVTVTETNGCTGTASANVTEQASLTITFAQDTVTICAGGTATLVGTASGGDGNYTYTWTTPGGPSTGDTLLTAQAGTFILDAIDGAGCAGQDSAVVSIASSLPVSITGPAGLCPADSAQLSTVPVPQPGWVVQWNSPAGPSMQYPLTAFQSGLYQITLTDTQGCSGSAQTSLAAWPAPIVSVDPATASLCPGNSVPLTASVSASGPATTYTWQTPLGSGNGPTFTASQAGNYIATVGNATGCTGSALASVTQAAGLAVDFDPDTVSMCTGGTATLSPVVSGGVFPYQYVWSTPGGPASTDTLHVGQPGTYAVTITDQNGCTGEASLLLVSSAALSVGITPANPGFCPGQTVQIQAAAPGATPPAVFTWTTPNGPANGPMLTTGLGGLYAVTVTDATGCSGTTMTTVNAWTAPTVQIDPSSGTLCPGQILSLTAQGTGGQSPFQFDWAGPNGPSTGPLVTAGAPGNWTVILSDTHGCRDTATTILSAAPDITITLDPTIPSLCSGSSAQVTATTTGGTPPFLYQWTGPGFQSQANPVVIDSAGQYSLLVTDANGCSGSLGLNVPAGAGLQVAILTTMDTICIGQTYQATANVTGGTLPFIYVWATPAGPMTSMTVGLTIPGTVTVTVTDADGCSGSDEAVVAEGKADLLFQVTDAACPGVDNGGFSLLPASLAVLPLTLSVNGGSPVQVQSLPYPVTGLAPGVYTLAVTDMNGCTTLESLIVDILTDPSIQFDPALVHIVRGDGTILNPIVNFSPNDYSWTPSNDLSCTGCPHPVASPTQTQTYLLTATDADGCEAQGEVTVIVVGNTRIYLPTAFSPDKNGINDVLYIQSADPEVQVDELRVFDRWGNELFVSDPGPANDSAFGWNGEFRGKDMDPGVYIYTALILFPDGTRRLYKGEATLMK